MKYVKMEKQGITVMRQPNKNSKQELLQIWLPLIVSIMVCVVLLVLSITLTSGNLGTIGTLSDIALILIIAPLFLVFFSVLLLVIALGKIILNLNQKIPPILTKGQRITSQVSQRVNAIAMVTTLPIVKFLSIKSAINRFFGITSRRTK